MKLKSWIKAGGCVAGLLWLLTALPAVFAAGFNSDPSAWHDFFCLDDEVCAVGDFNGDGRDDIITFVRSTTSGGQVGDVYVALSTGSSFAAATQWQELFCIDSETCAIGDVNGDGRADIVAFVRSTSGGGQVGDVYVALSTGSSFAASAQWQESFCLEQSICTLADVSGDGRADAVAFVHGVGSGASDGNVNVALSTGSAFAAASTWNDFFCIGDETCALADVNNDQQADAITFVRSTRSGSDTGNVFVALSTGSQFSAASLWHDTLCIRSEQCAMGDVNGDGFVDALSFVKNTRSGPRQGDVYVALSNGATFGTLAERWSDFFCIDGEQCAVGDFNGDGRDDIVTFIRDTQSDATRGDVYVALSDPSLASPIIDPGPALNEHSLLPFIIK